MTKIIRSDFSGQDFEQIVKEFLYANTQASLPVPLLKEAEIHLLNYSDMFPLLHSPFFEMDGNSRYDLMVNRMTPFIDMVFQNTEKAEEQKKVVVLFWHHISDILEADYTELKVAYLSNTTRYFVYELRRLSYAPSSVLPK